MQKEKRAIIIFDGQFYKRGEFIQEPIMVKAGFDEIRMPIGEFKKTLKVIKGDSLVEISVSHYTITLRKSGRYVYEFFGRVSKREYITSNKVRVLA